MSGMWPAPIGGCETILVQILRPVKNGILVQHIL